jgi:hypothetical protein
MIAKCLAFLMYKRENLGLDIKNDSIWPSTNVFFFNAISYSSRLIMSSKRPFGAELRKKTL